MNTKWIKLGVVGRAHGLRGSFFVSGRDEPLPDTLKKLIIGPTPETGVVATIEQCQWQNGRSIIKCDIATDRTSAEKWTGKQIWCDASAVVVDEETEYLVSDLKGRVVVDSDGKEFGVVDDVAVMPASVNLIVVNADASADVEVPMIATYVDMSFIRGEKTLALAVPGDTFADVWNPKVKKR